MTITAIAHAAFWPLVAAVVLITVAAAVPRQLHQRTPWGLFAAVEWLFALDLLVVSHDEGPVIRGLTWLCAAVRVWQGLRYYRRWRDDDENRPRRRRRVLIRGRRKLAGGAL